MILTARFSSPFRERVKKDIARKKTENEYRREHIETASQAFALFVAVLYVNFPAWCWSGVDMLDFFMCLARRRGGVHPSK